MIRRLLLSLCVIMCSMNAVAAEPGIIEVKGLGSEPIRLTMEQLQAMPSASFDTLTPWTEGKTQFKGVRLQALMEQLKVESDVIRVIALNQYHADVHWKELSSYPVIIAYEMNGEPMSIRDKGPYWLMFPLTDFPELDVPKHHITSVWQIAVIEVL